MTRIPRFSALPLLTLAAVLLAAGCHGNTDQNTATTANAADQSQSGDPASANLAPISNATGTSTQTTASDQQAAPAAGQSAPATDQSAATGSSVSTTDDSDYGEQPTVTAPEPPPPLPEYSQPSAPSDDYLWTPGYWAWAPAGYYWVPGVWVQAPYTGALWTPGYWGFVHGRYGFFPGYWGLHIGFYGGINYGFGYSGLGYLGGYWNSGHFFYNRSVNNINVSIIHNVYTYPVRVTNERVSFHGGRGGIEVRPRPAELAAFHEPHAPAMRAQIQNEHAASQDHAQFANVNHGRPESLVINKPLEADRDVHPVARPEARGMTQHAAPAARPEPRMEARPAERPAPHAVERPAPHAAERPAPRAETRPAERPAEHPAAKPHAAVRPAERPKAPEAQKRPEERPRR